MIMRYQRVNESPVFIVGMSRSGTTLIRSILTAHPRIAIPNELALHRWNTKNIEVKRSTFDIFWDKFTSHKQFAWYGVNAAAARENIEASGDFSLRGVYAGLCRAHADSLGKPRWGEKTPKNFARLDQLLGWFPSAQVLFALRDPRAVCSSMITRPDVSRFVQVHAAKWNEALNAMERWKDDKRIHVVRYENLVMNPEKEVRSWCNFLNEDFFSEMLERRKQTISKDGVRNWQAKQYERAMGPISNDSISKWCNNLSSYQISVIEHVAGCGMDRYGYERKGLPLGAFGRVRLRIGKFIARYEKRYRSRLYYYGIIKR
jgi:hypothetical protein